MVVGIEVPPDKLITADDWSMGQ